MLIVFGLMLIGVGIMRFWKAFKCYRAATQVASDGNVLVDRYLQRQYRLACVWGILYLDGGVFLIVSQVYPR